MAAPNRKMRLDRLLVEKGLAESRDKARRLIMAGKVFVGEERVDRASAPVAPDVGIRVARPPHPYVSRGGVKLAGALDHFCVDPSGRIAADFGSSTGGFTDCLLRRGASRVYAIDVGTYQLDYRMRKDARVCVMERFNVRYLRREDLPELVSLVTIDLSFISALLVLEGAANVLEPGGEVLTLVKPQFEIGKGRVGKGGIVRDPKDHLEVLKAFSSGAEGKKFRVWGVVPSPIRGAEGNLEFFAYLRQDGVSVDESELERAVAQAHSEIARTARDSEEVEGV